MDLPPVALFTTSPWDSGHLTHLVLSVSHLEIWILYNFNCVPFQLWISSSAKFHTSSVFQFSGRLKLHPRMYGSWWRQSVTYYQSVRILSFLPPKWMNFSFFYETVRILGRHVTSRTSLAVHPWLHQCTKYLHSFFHAPVMTYGGRSRSRPFVGTAITINY